MSLRIFHFFKKTLDTLLCAILFGYILYKKKDGKGSKREKPKMARIR